MPQPRFLADAQDLVRAIRALRRSDGAALGALLRKHLPGRERRRAGASVLASEAVAFEFEGGGFEWVAPAGDLISVQLLADGEWLEWMAVATSNWIRTNCSRPGAVLEVGAHIGTTTLVLAREGWHVIALEPVPLSRGFLMRNLDRNGLADQVTVVASAIAERSGPVRMTIPRAHGAARIADDGDLEVPGETLAEIAERSGDVAFVWGAADRSELLTIRSGVGLWGQGVPLYLKLLPQHDTAVADECAEHFHHFVGLEEIRERGESAPLRPIGELGGYLTDRARYLDVLLIKG